tara:strand:+ start:19019 stop:19966 length:948 start_codon:yes stop_codon:yes gene_type:complete
MWLNHSDAFLIPTVDLSTGAAAQAVDDACRRHGFFYLTGHGVSSTVTEKAFAAAARFFAAPLETKNAYHIRHSHPHQRGYVPLFEESLDEGALPDFKESFDMGVDRAPNHPDVLTGKLFAAPNIWPPVPGFREAIEAYHLEMMRLGLDLVRLTACALGLPSGYFDEAMGDPVGNLRLLHYPAAENEQVQHGHGCGAHTDYGFLTVLAQDDVGGLEVEGAGGRWMPLAPRPDAFVVNLGDLLTHWTGGLYQARRHRVVNAGARERYSIPFFLDPNVDAEINVVPTCRHLPGAGAYQPVNAGAFLQGRFDATFTYRK